MKAQISVEYLLSLVFSILFVVIVTITAMGLIDIAQTMKALLRQRKVSVLSAVFSE